MVDSENIDNVDVCIVGAGIAGMFVASKLLSANFKVKIFESNSRIGGQVNLYLNKTIYNIPLIDKIKGFEILNKIKQDVENNSNINNMIIFNTFPVEIKKIENGFEILDNFKKKIKCKYLILAFGAGGMVQNKICLDNANDLEKNGMLFYSVENKDLFISKDIVISGGGDSVIDWVCELSDICKSITVIHRREINNHKNPLFLKFKSLCENGKIILKTPYNITNISSNDKENYFIDISSLKDNTKEKIKCNNLLVFYGFSMSHNNIINVCNELDIQFNNNKVFVNFNNETNCKNVFSIGDCCCYDGKISNIFAGFFDSIRCFYEICNREYGKINTHI